MTTITTTMTTMTTTTICEPPEPGSSNDAFDTQPYRRTSRPQTLQPRFRSQGARLCENIDSLWRPGVRISIPRPHLLY
jgi:hypothetical protein